MDILREKGVSDKVSTLPDFQYHPMCEGIKLTHLIFTDHLMIFCKGDVNSIGRVTEALDHFSRVTDWFTCKFGQI